MIDMDRRPSHRATATTLLTLLTCCFTLLVAGSAPALELFEYTVEDVAMEWSIGSRIYKSSLDIDLGRKFASVDSVRIQLFGSFGSSPCIFEAVMTLTNDGTGYPCRPIAGFTALHDNINIDMPFRLANVVNSCGCPISVQTCSPATPADYGFMRDGVCHLNIYFMQPYQWCKEDGKICFDPGAEVDLLRLQIWNMPYVDLPEKTWGTLKAIYR